LGAHGRFAETEVGVQVLLYTTKKTQRITMQKRTIGSLEVSVVGVGCNNFGVRSDAATSIAVVNSALEAGINFFDTADIYGATKSEVILGEALGDRRANVVVATKFGMPVDDDHFGAAPKYVRRACEDSLKRLGTDYIDLYQLHAPDDTVPIGDTLGALDELVVAGKVREIGCSNLSAAQLHDATVAAGNGARFVSVQNQFSLLAREPERDGVLDACSELGLGFLPFYPLANGLLTGKIRPGEPIPEGSRLAKMAPERSAHWLGEPLRVKVDALVRYAEQINVPLLNLAFSWLLHHEQVSSVIAGASSAAQVSANAAAPIDLSAEQVATLNQLTA
jgi:aryl-alcohol dehydrogenase-like predicted oxidoreductase